MQRSWAVWAFIAGVVALAVAVFALWLAVWPAGLHARWSVACTCGALAAVALLAPLRFTRGYKMTVATAPEFASLLLLGPPVAMLTVAIANGSANLILFSRRRRSLRNTVFNTAQSVLLIGLAGQVLFGAGLIPLQDPLPLANPAALSGALLAGASLLLLNPLPVSIAVSLQQRSSLLATYLNSWRADALPSSVLLLAGLLAAVLSQVHPWALWLMVVPMAVTYQQLSRLFELLESERAARAAAEASADRLQRVQRVTDAALGHLAVDDLLEDVLARITDALPCDTASVLLLEPDGERFAVRASHGLEAQAGLRLRVPGGEGFVGQIAATKEALLVADLSAESSGDQWLSGLGIRSLVGAPLVVTGQPFGVVCVGSRRQGVYTFEDRWLLRLVADRVAMAVDHARLFEAEQDARAQAEAAVQVRSEFLSVASHELRTPITSLRGYTQLLLHQHARVGSDPIKLRRAVEVIDRQSEKLSRLVVQLLDVSRIQRGRLVLDCRPTDVVRLVTEAVEAIRQGTSQPIVLSAPPSLWARVDALRLEQVVTNLIDNAIKYGMNNGAVEVDVGTHDGAEGTTCVRISVRDRGIGIPAEHRQHVFERFYEVDASRQVGGMGLGLYISRQIVDLHHGTIAVEAPPDGGTRLVVLLPRDLEVREEASIDDGGVIGRDLAAAAAVPAAHSRQDAA